MKGNHLNTSVLPARPSLSFAHYLSMLAVSILLSALALCFCSLPGSVQALNDTVELDYGTFVGSRNESTGVISYRGIRFAEPPVGDLRWRLPVMPPTTHQGVVNASEYGPTCITTKLSGSTIPSTMSEDCLFGNIYVPVGTNETSNLPVLIYYHGGGYQAGSARSAPPEWLLASSKEPFIFATFQYRLGQFGFLGGAALGVNGVVNAGLLDQRASMRWVQKYISSFGGDKSRVTIWGQSAGSGSTMFHLIANGGNNEGLFHQAMGDSPALSAMPNYYEPLADTVFARFATLAGCDVLGIQDVMVCLRNANVTDLAAAGNATARFFTSRLFIFSPIVDGKFIRERPVSAFRGGRFAKVPVFFGSNTDEGANWSAGLSDPLANAATPGATSYNAYGFLRGQYADLTPTTFLRASQLYQHEEFNSSYARLVQQMYGEMRFICTAGLITGSAAAAGVDAYQYHYDNPRLGSFHHDELQAMFSTEQVDTEEEDDVMFEKMRQYWTSFATKGKPSTDDGPEWTPSDGYFGEPRMLLNPSNVEMEEIGNDLASRCRLWHDDHFELLT